MNVARAREREPVVFDAAISQWFAFLYEDVRAGLADPGLTADRMLGFADRAPASVVEPVRRHAAWLMSRDGADYGWRRPVVHAGLRGAASPASERAIALAADELLDGLLEQGTFDIAGDYAFALSGRVLADILGVDRDDGDRLMRWARRLVEFFNDVPATQGGAERMARAAAEMAAYGHELLTDRGAAQRGGFLGLVAQAAARRGHALDDVGVGQIMLPFLTGQAGVAQLVVNAVWLLLDHQDERARLRADPDLLAGAVTETMRYAPPVALAPRIALERIALGGMSSSRGRPCSSASRRPTATRRASPTPSASTSRGMRAGRWASGMGRTAASAWGSPGCRRRPRSSRSCAAPLTSPAIRSARWPGGPSRAFRDPRRWAYALQQRP
jgi:cytochrome P450